MLVGAVRRSHRLANIPCVVSAQAPGLREDVFRFALELVRREIGALYLPVDITYECSESTAGHLT